MVCMVSGVHFRGWYALYLLVLGWGGMGHTVLTRHYAPPFCRLDLATSMGGGHITVISLVYTPPFLVVERVRETVMAEMSVRVSCGLQ